MSGRRVRSAPVSSGGVRVRDLSFAYPGRTLWAHLSFDTEPGGLVAVRGESGSGKTTLLQCLGSLTRPSSGSLEVCGTRVEGLRGAALRSFRREVVGFAFQNTGIVASWTVRKNRELGGFRVADHLADVASAFDRFELGQHLLGVPAFRLSGGEQQRVGIIRLLLQKPALLLLDEPTSALDDENANRVIDFLLEHCAEGGIAVVATHDPRVIEHATSVVSLQPARTGTK